MTPRGPGARRRAVVPPLLVAGATLAFLSPMLWVPDGIGTADAFRDNDWLNCRSFDVFSRRALLEDHEFPLRSHLVGGGFPIAIHPSDGSWAPTLPAVLLFGDVLGVKLNIAWIALLGALGVFGLARRWLKLTPAAAAFAALTFAFAGWAPSMLLVGFYHQLFYLLVPPLLWLLVASPRSPLRLLLAGFVLFMILQQGGHAFPAVVHFLGVTCWLLAAARAFPGAPSWRRWGAPLALLVLLLAGLPVARQLGVVWAALLGPALAALWVAVSPAQRRFLAALAPWAGRLAAVVGVAALLGAARVAGLAVLAGGGRYPSGLGAMGPWLGGRDPHEYWIERFYEAPAIFLQGLLQRVPSVASYGEVFGRAGSNVDYEYAWIGLTLPPLLLALTGIALAGRRRKVQLLTLLAVVYAVICFGWYAPVDLHFLLVRGLPWLDQLSQPLKYFNFFVLLALALLAGVGVDQLARRLGRRRRLEPLARQAWTGRVGWAALPLLLWPALQNAPALGELFAEPRPAAPAEPFHQVALIGDPSWLQMSDAALLERSNRQRLRDFRRPREGTEYHNVRRGVGTVDWYGTVMMAEAAIPAVYLTLDGERLPNPRYRGEAWTRSGGGTIHAVEVRPNTVTVDVELDGADVVVVNQNHLRGFRVDGGELREVGGLLAAAVDGPGRHTLEFRYRPPWILAAFALSALSAFGWLVAVAGFILRSRGAR